MGPFCRRTNLIDLQCSLGYIVDMIPRWRLDRNEKAAIKRPALHGAVFGLLCLVFSGLWFGLSARAETQHTKLRVVTTTGMITDVVRHIAGDRITLVGLIGAGVDPHLFRATRSDIATLSGADIIFFNGLLLEGKLTDALNRVASSGKAVHAVTELLDTSSLRELSGFPGHYDPHVWMNPRAWLRTVDVIETKLSARDPAGASVYREAAARYKQTLEELDRYAERVLQTVPTESRVLITAHDAFEYFGSRYGYTVRGIQGLSTDSEAGVQDIERLVSEIVEKKIKAVFVESTVPTKSVTALIEGAQARGHTVTVGGELFSDAMGAPGTYEGTYLGMIDHNVTTIARALGGDAPEKGMQGKLGIPGEGR